MVVFIEYKLIDDKSIAVNWQDVNNAPYTVYLAVTNIGIPFKQAKKTSHKREK